MSPPELVTLAIVPGEPALDGEVVPRKEVGRRLRWLHAIYIVLLILFSVLSAGAGTLVAVLTAGPKVREAEDQAGKAQSEARESQKRADAAVVELDEAQKRRVEETEKAKAEAVKAKAEAEESRKRADAAEADRKEGQQRRAQETNKAREDALKAAKENVAADALLKQQLEKAEEETKAAKAMRNKAETEAKNAQEQAAWNADSTAQRGESLRAKDAEIVSLKETISKLRNEKPEPPPSPPPLKAGGRATVQMVIGPGVLCKSDGGDEPAEKKDTFEEGATVEVVAVTKTGVQIAGPGRARIGWLTAGGAAAYLQPIQEK